MTLFPPCNPLEYLTEFSVFGKLRDCYAELCHCKLALPGVALGSTLQPSGEAIPALVCSGRVPAGPVREFSVPVNESGLRLGIHRPLGVLPALLSPSVTGTALRRQSKGVR